MNTKSKRSTLKNENYNERPLLDHNNEFHKDQINRVKKSVKTELNNHNDKNSVREKRSSKQDLEEETLRQEIHSSLELEKDRFLPKREKRSNLETQDENSGLLREKRSSLNGEEEDIGILHREKRSNVIIDSSHVQVYPRWKMQVIYLATGDKDLNVFTEERLKMIHNIEQVNFYIINSLFFLSKMCNGILYWTCD